MDLKETKELLSAIQLLAVSGVDIAKGGLGAEDLPKALELIKKSDVIIAGVKGLDQVGPELKDLDEKELLELGTAAYLLVKDVVAAVKKEAA